MSLREKLQQLNHLAEDASTGETLDAWRRAIASLYDKVRGYLAEYAKDGLVEFETRVVSRSEDALGTYDVDMLLVHMGPRSVIFSPVARYDLGGDGRVNMYVQGRMDHPMRLRWIGAPGTDGTWAIALLKVTPTGINQQTRPLTKSTLEQGLDLLLG